MSKGESRKKNKNKISKENLMRHIKAILEKGPLHLYLFKAKKKHIKLN